MIFFSEIIKHEVKTEDLIPIGKLEDIVFLASEKPLITGIVVNYKGQKIIIPIQYFLRLTPNSIIIEKKFSTVTLKKNELFVKKNLIDRQIIDIKGNKVVRVNDIVFQQKNDKYSILGVDISFLGVLRWFGIDDIVIELVKFILNKNLSPNILPWKNIQPLELEKGKILLKEEEEKIEKIHPADLADYLEQTNVENTIHFLDELDDKLVGDIVNNLNINYQTAIFRKLKPKKATQILNFVDPDEAVDILVTLPYYKRKRIVDNLDEEAKKEISYLLKMSKTPIGEAMTSEYFVVYPEEKVRNVILRIRKEGREYSFLNYIYVVNKNNQLVGVIDLYELIAAQPNTPIYKIMISNVVSIYLSTPKKLALKKMLKYKLSALPVISSNKKMLGIVTFDDISEELEKKL